MKVYADKRMDNSTINALRQGDEKAFRTIYQSCYPMIYKFILANSGTANDAEDIFQEALFVLVKKIRESDFSLTSNLRTYLYAVCRNLWFKKKRKKKVKMIEKDKEIVFDTTEDAAEEALEKVIERDEMLKVMTEKLEELEEDCRQVILFAFYCQLSHSEIALKMGYSEAFVRVKKFRCLKYLRKKVKDLPVFKTFKTDYL